MSVFVNKSPGNTNKCNTNKRSRFKSEEIAVLVSFSGVTTSPAWLPAVPKKRLVVVRLQKAELAI
jgi:hypothetical protein